ALIGKWPYFRFPVPGIPMVMARVAERFSHRNLGACDSRDVARTFREQSRCHGWSSMFFAFPEDARWDSNRCCVAFGIAIGEYEGVVRVYRRAFQSLLNESPTPERCLE